MSNSPSNAGRESSASSPKEANINDNGTSRGSPTASAELLRLQNIIKVKDKDLDEARKEISALKTALHTKERAVVQTEQELRLLKERHATTETEVKNLAKELAVIKVEKKKLEAEVSDLVRKGQTEQSMPVLLANKPSLVSLNSGENAFGAHPVLEQVASLKEDLKTARQDGERAAESVKILDNLLRAKDRQIHTLKRKLDDIQMYKVKVVGLENRVSELVKQVTGEKASGRTAGDVTRVTEFENTRLAADLLRVRTALEASQELAARTSAAAKVSEVRCAALEQEVSTLVGELARASAVAKRVAVSEVKAGCKYEGVVHVTRHLEEVRFMMGEVGRLQQRIAVLEKELAVSDELKERYRLVSEAAGSSNSASDGGSSPTVSPSAGGLTYRPGAARHTAPTTPRRPATAGGATTTTTTITVTTPRPTRPASAGGLRISIKGEASSGATAVRRSSKKLPWNYNPEAPMKLAVAAVADSKASTNVSAAAAGGGGGVVARRLSAKARAQVAVRNSVKSEAGLEAGAGEGVVGVVTPAKEEGGVVGVPAQDVQAQDVQAVQDV